MYYTSVKIYFISNYLFFEFSFFVFGVMPLGLRRAFSCGTKSAFWCRITPGFLGRALLDYDSDRHDYSKTRCSFRAQCAVTHWVVFAGGFSEIDRTPPGWRREENRKIQAKKNAAFLHWRHFWISNTTQLYLHVASSPDILPRRRHIHAMLETCRLQFKW